MALKLLYFWGGAVGGLHSTSPLKKEVRQNFETPYLCLFIWLQQILVAVCGIYFPEQGLNPGPLYWELRVLAPGPSETSEVPK